MLRLADETPEGKSIVELAESKGYQNVSLTQTKSYIYQISLPKQEAVVWIYLDGKRIRKGAFDAITKHSDKGRKYISR